MTKLLFHRTHGVPALVLVLMLSMAAMLSGQDRRLGGRTPAEIAQEVRIRFGGLPRSDRDAVYVAPGETCLTPLFARLREAAPAFSAAERAELAALDPNVALAIDLGLGTARANLPEYPDLDQTAEGTSCILYYTLTGENAVISAEPVEYMVKLIDRLALKLGKTLRAPYAETDGSPDRRLRVYVAKLADDPVLGAAAGLVQACVDVTGVTGQPRTVYMALSSNQLAKAGEESKVWKKRIKSTCTHEYMHCVQFAYNYQLSRWALEGQAVWAENRIANETETQIAFLETAESILRATEKPIWEETLRMYSTSPLFHYADLVLGKDAPRLILEGALAQDDGLLVFKALAEGGGVPWDEFYKGFLARLWNKTIPRLSKKIFPEITMVEAPINTYGWQGTGEIAVTGYQVRMFDPPGTYPTSLFFAKISRAGAMTGTPSGVILHSGGKRLAIGTGYWDNVDTFSRKYAVLVVTDTAYTAQTAVTTPYLAEVFAPHIEVKECTSVSPVTQGTNSTITFTYDLLGMPFGQANATVVLHVVRKGPVLPINSPTFPTWAVGTDRTATYIFTPPGGADAIGTYSFKFYAKVPTDAYGGSHIRSISSTKVKVLEP